MKKIFVIALAAASMCFVSCKQKSVEDQAKDYVDQIIAAQKAGDEAKAKEIGEDMEKWMKGLSEADQMTAGLIMLGSMSDMMEASGVDLDAAAEALGDAEEEATEAVEEAEEAIEEAVEEIAE